MKKHPQFILAIDNTFFTCRDEFGERINHYDFQRFLQDVQSHLVVREREHLEKNPAYRQLLPYAVIEQTDADGITRLSSYRRTSGVGESRLAGNVSIGYGGHIDLQDVYIDDKSVVGLQPTIFESMLRELTEEITLSREGVRLMEDEVHEVFKTHCKFRLFDKNFILDNANEVGTVHVGLVFVFTLPPEFVIESREDELSTMPLLTPHELHQLDAPKENWTQLILDEMMAQAATA
jgi:predicted NUDIX family phosphoesterase